MYNQNITSTDGATWIYTPIKYWPNEIAAGNVDDKGAQGAAVYGNVSFFAYAPYWDKSDSPTDGITALTPNNEAGDPKVTYVIPSDMNTGGGFVDLLWGTRGTNTSENVVGTANSGVTGTGTQGTLNTTYAATLLTGRATNTNLTKQKTGGKVDFNFIHALAGIGGGTDFGGAAGGVQIVLDIDKNNALSGGTREEVNLAGEDKDSWNTIVTVDNITITNDLTNDGDAEDTDETPLRRQGTLNLATGQWESLTTVTSDVISQTIGNTNATDTYDAEINSKIAEYWKDTDASDAKKTWISKNSTDVKNYFNKTLTAVNTGNHPGVTETAQSVFNEASQSPLLLIPGQTPTFKISITYTVRTYDAALANKYTEVKQTISKNVTFGAPVEINKKYNLLIHLGLTEVKFTASVSSWDSGHIGTGGGGSSADSDEVYLPINVVTAP